MTGRTGPLPFKYREIVRSLIELPAPVFEPIAPIIAKA
jgi:hypothetical protein